MTSGCFRYAQVPSTSLELQEEARVRVTDDAAIRLARELGRISPQLDGRLEPHEPDSVLVTIWIGRNHPGTSFENVHQTVTIAHNELVDVQRRTFSVGRTALVSVGALAVFAYLTTRIFQQEDPNTRPPTDQVPPPPLGAIRIPIGFGGFR